VRGCRTRPTCHVLAKSGGHHVRGFPRLNPSFAGFERRRWTVKIPKGEALRRSRGVAKLTRRTGSAQRARVGEGRALSKIFARDYGARAVGHLRTNGSRVPADQGRGGYWVIHDGGASRGLLAERRWRTGAASTRNGRVQGARAMRRPGRRPQRARKGTPYHREAGGHPLAG